MAVKRKTISRPDSLRVRMVETLTSVDHGGEARALPEAPRHRFPSHEEDDPRDQVDYLDDGSAREAYLRQWLRASQHHKMSERIEFIADGCRVLMKHWGLPQRFGRFVVCGSLCEAAEPEGQPLEGQMQRLHRRANGSVRDTVAAVGEFLPYIVRHPGLLEPEDTDKHDATVLLDCCDYAVELLKNGAPIEAMRLGLEIGTKAATLAFLQRHERHAIRGRDNAQHLAEGGPTANRNRKEKAQAEWAAWQRKADEVWLRHPTWTNAAVAAEVRKWLVLQSDPEGKPQNEVEALKVRSKDIIARRIKKGRKAQ